VSVESASATAVVALEVKGIDVSASRAAKAELLADKEPVAFAAPAKDEAEPPARMLMRPPICAMTAPRAAVAAASTSVAFVELLPPPPPAAVAFASRKLEMLLAVASAPSAPAGLVTLLSASITPATLAAEIALQLAALVLPGGETVPAGHGAGSAPKAQKKDWAQAVQFAALVEPSGEERPAGHGPQMTSDNAVPAAEGA
jgi:hypothetical protein